MFKAEILTQRVHYDVRLDTRLLMFYCNRQSMISKRKFYFKGNPQTKQEYKKIFKDPLEDLHPGESLFNPTQIVFVILVDSTTHQSLVFH